MAVTGIPAPEFADKSVVSLPGEAEVPQARARLAFLSWDRAGQFIISIADQGLAVGGGFLANVALARMGTKEEYGMFALCYSVFTFIMGLHNAAILEPFTVYGSGRYRNRFSDYLRLMARSHLLFSLVLSGFILLVCLVFWWMASHLVSRALVGLGLTLGILLSGIFLRRAFYVRREPLLAAKSSLVFFVVVVLGLAVTLKLGLLNGFWVFVILALGWTAAGASYGGKLRFGKPPAEFLKSEPRYLSLHWEYSRWVFATAFVFQLMTQGYYWLVAGFLSVREVGELRAMYNLISPVDQVFIALSYLALPAMASHYAAKRMGSLLFLWKRYAMVVLCVTVAFAMGVRFLGKPVMHMLYAGKFDDLAPLLSVLALLPLFLAVGNTMNDALKSLEQPKLVFYAYLCSGVATFIGGIPLVRYFGLQGAVYGMLLSGISYTGALALGFLSASRRQVNRMILS